MYLHKGDLLKENVVPWIWEGAAVAGIRRVPCREPSSVYATGVILSAAYVYASDRLTAWESGFAVEVMLTSGGSIILMP